MTSRVTLTNPFDLLTDENEDRTNVPAPKPTKEQKPAAPAKPAAKPAATGAAVPKPESAKAPAKPADAKAAPKPQPPASSPNTANQTVKPAPPRDTNQNLQERDKESRAPRDKKDRAPAYPAADPKKRPFDRKSGTGRPQNEVKRGGQGKGNWGGEVDVKEGADALKDKEEKLDEKEEGDESKEEKPAATTEEGEKGEKKEEEGAAKEEEKKPAPEELTYDEYLAKLKQKAPKVEALKPRTVNADDFSAAGLVPLQRGEEATPPLNSKEKKEKKEKGEKPEKKEGKKEKSLAAQLLTFSTHQDEKRKERFGSNPRTDYGGGRGGGERRGGGQGPRGDRPPRTDSRGSLQQTASGTQPPVQPKDFPALGPHGSDQPVKA